jgi:hypothetical protein
MEARLAPISRAILVALMLILAACGAAPATGGTSPAPAPTAVPSPRPTPASEPTAALSPAASPNAGERTVGPAGAEALVVYHKTGGIAGIDQTLTVYADGRIELKRRNDQRTGQATATALAELKQLLGSPEFTGLGGRYPAQGADLFSYDISVPTTGQRVITMDGATNPPALDQAIAALEQLIATVS